MLALTVRNPWGTLIALGAKTIETRGKATDYRGWLAIHTSQVFPAEAIPLLSESAFVDALSPFGLLLPTHFQNGYVIAVAHLKYCLYTGDKRFDYPQSWVPEPFSHEWHFGNFDPGRFGWVFDRVIRIPNGIKQRGNKDLWQFDEKLLPRKVYEEMTEPVLAL